MDTYEYGRIFKYSIYLGPEWNSKRYSMTFCRSTFRTVKKMPPHHHHQRQWAAITAQCEMHGFARQYCTFHTCVVMPPRCRGALYKTPYTPHTRVHVTVSCWRCSVGMPTTQKLCKCTFCWTLGVHARDIMRCRLNACVCVCVFVALPGTVALAHSLLYQRFFVGTNINTLGLPGGRGQPIPSDANARKTQLTAIVGDGSARPVCVCVWVQVYLWPRYQAAKFKRTMHSEPTTSYISPNTPFRPHIVLPPKESISIYGRYMYISTIYLRTFFISTFTLLTWISIGCCFRE